jgi:transposase
MDFVTSSGGPSTKIHALVDALGNPLAFLLTPGQVHNLVGAVSIENRLDESPTVLGGCAGIANFPRKQVLDSLQATQDGAARVRPRTYKARHLIENFFCKFKQFRAIATPYDKTARNFLAAIPLAAAIVWLN